jgi:hypothetical protein
MSLQATKTCRQSAATASSGCVFSNLFPCSCWLFWVSTCSTHSPPWQEKVSWIYSFWLFRVLVLRWQMSSQPLGQQPTPGCCCGRRSSSTQDPKHAQSYEKWAYPFSSLLQPWWQGLSCLQVFFFFPFEEETQKGISQRKLLMLIVYKRHGPTVLIISSGWKIVAF